MAHFNHSNHNIHIGQCSVKTHHDDYSTSPRREVYGNASHWIVGMRASEGHCRSIIEPKPSYGMNTEPTHPPLTASLLRRTQALLLVVCEDDSMV